VVHAAGDQWLRRPAPSDLKVIVVDIDCASIDALGTWPWPRESMARLVEAVATGRHPDGALRSRSSNIEGSKSLMVGIVRPPFSFISVVYFRNSRSVIVLKRRQETPRLLRDGGRDIISSDDQAVGFHHA
jgi:CHASE2 domain